MGDVYSELKNQLGCPVESVDWNKLSNLLGENPIEEKLDSVWFHMFPESGLEIIAVRNEQRMFEVYAVLFYIDVPAIREGSMKRYCGQFLAGVTSDDSFESVKRKISTTPTDLYAEFIKKLCYDFPDHRLVFDFHEPGGERLALVSITGPRTNN